MSHRICLKSAIVGAVFVSACSSDTSPTADAEPQGDLVVEAVEPAIEFAALPEPFVQADFDQGRKTYRLCQSCHTLQDGGTNLVGPILYGMFGRQAGAGEAADLWQLFDGLQNVPLATIKGANSDLFAQSTLEKMKARRPDMISAVVPDRGHVPFLDEPEALAAIHQLLDAT